jgi:hypothetical protein
VCKVLKYMFMCSVWWQHSFLEKWIHADRYVQKKPDKYAWCTVHGTPISISQWWESGRSLVFEDRLVTITQTAQKIRLGFHKVCARCVPRQVTEEHKHSCMDTDRHH